MIRSMLAVAVVVMMASPSIGQAEVIFSESFTGADLYSDARVSFLTRTPSVSGSSLLFDTGSEFAEKLFVLSLLPGDTLSAYNPVVVDISMNLTATESAWPTVPRDYDPGAMVGDGDVLIGYLAADNFGGTIVGRTYADAGDHGVMTGGLDMLTGVGYPAIGESFDVFGTITLFPNSTEVSASFLGGSASHTFGQAIDRSQPFNFTFIAHDAEERYHVNSLSIQISGEAVPEPTSLVLWCGLGVMGLVAARRRKRAA